MIVTGMFTSVTFLAAYYISYLQFACTIPQSKNDMEMWTQDIAYYYALSCYPWAVPLVAVIWIVIAIAKSTLSIEHVLLYCLVQGIACFLWLQWTWLVVYRLNSFLGC